MRRLEAFSIVLVLILAIGLGSGRVVRAAQGPSYCSKTGTPLQSPVVGGGSFGFAVSVDHKAETIVVGQPDATDGAGLVYNYNQVALCAYQSFELPAPPAPKLAADGAAPGLLGMMAALSRDGRWLAVAGTLEQRSTMAQVFIYRRAGNDSSSGPTFALHQKLMLQPAPTERVDAAPGKVYAGSLSIARDGRLVLVSWSVYGAGQAAGSDDPYGAPATAAYGSAQLYRRLQDEGRYTRAQADLARLAPPLARTQFFGANSWVTPEGNVVAVSTRVVDKTQPSGAPAIVVYRRAPSGVFELLTTLKVPRSDGAFAMTETGSHLAVVRGTDVFVYVLEGDLGRGRSVYNKRCTLLGEDMNLEPTYTKMAMTIANNSTLRLAIGNSLDSVFVWSIPLGGKRAYSDGTCPAVLDRTLTGETGSQFGTALAMSSDGKTLVVGAPGSAQHPDATVLVVDIALPKAEPPPRPQDGVAGILASLLRPPGKGGAPAGGPGGGGPGPGAGPAGAGVRASSTGAPGTGGVNGVSAASVPLDNTYFLSNPSSVLVSPRRGSVGVPAPQPFDVNSWAMGSPGGAPWSAQSGYSIAPQNPYVSGGAGPFKPGGAALGLLSAASSLGLTTAALRPASLSAG